MMLVACGGGGGSDSNSSPEDNEPPQEETLLSRIVPARSSSPYSAVLAPCSTAYQDQQSCLVDVLPPLDIQGQSVTVDDIMDRLVVSHPWMAERFEQALNAAPNSLLQMFAPLTAIVISYDIIPAFYHPLTGAMYIDPRFVWTNASEYNTIADKEDYRAGFSSDLSLDAFWRYVDEDGNSVTTSNTYSALNNNRTINQILPGLMNLLYHELAHANDFVPPTRRTAIALPAGNTSFYDLIEQTFNANEAIQQQLDDQVPLINNTLAALGQVLFAGNTATASQRALSAADAGSQFSIDGANDMYNYSSDAEDVAMLFENAMMSHVLGAIRDVAFVNQPSIDEPGCNDFTIGWGERGRLGQPWVATRAKLVVSEILPMQARDINAHIDQLPPATSLPVGLGWCNSRQVSALPFSVLRTIEPEQDHSVIEDFRGYRYH